MPGCCAPWPGNRKATGRRARRRWQRAPENAHGRTAGLDADSERPPRARSRADHGAPVREGLRPGLQGVGDVGERRAVRALRHSPRCAARRAVARVEGGGGAAPRAASELPGPRRRGAGVRRRRLLEHDVGVGAADAERADAGAARRRRRAASRRSCACRRRTGSPRSRSAGWAARSAGSAGARRARAPAPS